MQAGVVMGGLGAIVAIVVGLAASGVADPLHLSTMMRPRWTPSAEYLTKEQTVNDYADAIEELNGRFAAIHDLRSAQASISSIAESVPRLTAVENRLKALPSPGRADMEHLRKRVGPRLRAAIKTYLAEVRRLDMIPEMHGKFGVAVAEAEKMLRIWSGPEASDDSESAPDTAVAAAPPRAPALPPGMPPMPTIENAVNVEVENLPDDAARDLATERIKALPTDPGRFRSFIGSGGPNGRMSYQVGPVSDVDAFAKAITFGTVTSVSGRTIHVKADLPAAEVAERRAAIAAKKARDEAKVADQRHGGSTRPTRSGLA